MPTKSWHLRSKPQPLTKRGECQPGSFAGIRTSETPAPLAGRIQGGAGTTARTAARPIFISAVDLSVSAKFSPDPVGPASCSGSRPHVVSARKEHATCVRARQAAWRAFIGPLSAAKPGQVLDFADPPSDPPNLPDDPGHDPLAAAEHAPLPLMIYWRVRPINGHPMRWRILCQRAASATIPPSRNYRRGPRSSSGRSGTVRRAAIRKHDSRIASRTVVVTQTLVRPCQRNWAAPAREPPGGTRPRRACR